MGKWNRYSVFSSEEMGKAKYLLLAAGAASSSHAFSFAPTSLPSRTTTAPATPVPALRADWPLASKLSRRSAIRTAPRPMSVSAMAGEVVDKVAVVLLAGGVGSRMKAGKPKQFLELEGKTILRTSLDIFLNLKGVTSISVVLAEEYRDQLADVAAADPSTLNSIESFFYSLPIPYAQQDLKSSTLIRVKVCGTGKRATRFSFQRPADHSEGRVACVCARRSATPRFPRGDLQCKHPLASFFMCGL